MTAQTATLLAELVSALRKDAARETGSPATAAEDVTASLAEGSSVNKALFELCGETSGAVQSAIFGSAKIRYSRRNDVLLGSLGDQHLCVAIDCSATRQQLGLSGDTVFLDICGEGFVLSRRDSPKSVPIAALDLPAVLATIAFHGSLWDAVFPSHYALAIETIALTFPTFGHERLFAPEEGGVPGNRAVDAEARLSCFAHEFTEIQSLSNFASAFDGADRGPSLNSERTDSDLILRKYNPARSNIFDFGFPEEAVCRDDFVTTYVVDSREQHRDYAICPDAWSKDGAELRLATFDILNMLAIRRAKLFRADFAKRVFNVVFPPLIATPASGTGKTGYAIFPCLNLYRGEGAGFRRTASLSFTMAPVAVAPKRGLHCVARRASLGELYRLKGALDCSALAAASGQPTDCYRITSAAKGYYEGIAGEAHLSEQLLAIAADIASKAYPAGREPQRESALASMIAHARLEARVTTLLLQVEWRSPAGYAQPWEKWLSGDEDDVFSDALYRTLFYKDFLYPSTAYSSRRAVQLRKFNVGNTLGADMTGMTLFNPQERLKICLYSDAFEAYPNYSIIRWATWQIYIDSALTAMRALIFKFHPLMNTSSSLHGIMSTIRQMIREFVEFYDLDIREYFYRKEYEKLREQMQIDADYRQLKEKFTAAKEDQLLKEQRLINKLIVSLTIATVTVGVISTAAQMGRLSVTSYIALAALATATFTVLGYVLFDPIKLVWEGTALPLLRWWRQRHGS